MEPVDRILIVLLGAAEYLSEEDAPAEAVETSYYYLTKAIEDTLPGSILIAGNDNPTAVIKHYKKHPEHWRSFLRDELVNSALDQDEQVHNLTTVLMSHLPGKKTTHYPKRLQTAQRAVRSDPEPGARQTPPRP
jgi:hypothetical protein